jgi:hypothetical protein
MYNGFNAGLSSDENAMFLKRSVQKNEGMIMMTFQKCKDLKNTVSTDKRKRGKKCKHDPLSPPPTGSTHSLC